MGFIFVAFIAPLIITLYFLWCQTYWKRRGIDGPRGIPFLGSYYELSNPFKPRGLIIYEWTKKFGKVFGYYEGVNKVLVLSDLNMLQEMFIKKFPDFHARKLTNFIHADLEDPTQEPRVNIFSAKGSRWKRLRSLASPAFSVKALKQVHPIVEDSIITMVELMQKHADNDSFNIHEYFQQLTYDVISRLAMGQAQSEMFMNENSDVAKSIFMKTHRVLPWYLYVMFPQFAYYIKKAFYNHNNVQGGDMGKLTSYCRKAVAERIERRKENEKLGIENDVEDFIDMFLDCHVDQVQDQQFGQTVDKKATTEEVIGNCLIFLLAGFDTTANALGYTAYVLAKHPDVLEKAKAEIDEHCPNDHIDYDSVGKLTYVEAVIKEALRLYPVAFFACSRTAVRDTTLGDLRIDEGTEIEADVMTLHRSVEIWGPNASEFVPERWFEESTSARHVMSWMPFGAGPRQCLGMRLAFVESKLAIAHLLKRYNIISAPDTEEDVRLFGCTTVCPLSITVRLQSRY